MLPPSPPEPRPAPRPEARPGVRPGFSLVEILVVLGVLAVLVAILLPAIGRGRTQGVRTKCLANTRSANTLVLLYAADWKDYFPFAGYERRLEAHPLTAPEHVPVGGTRVGARWTLHFPDQWQGDRWDPALQCPRQDAWALANPAFAGELRRFPFVQFGAAFTLEPAALDRPELESSDSLPVRPSKVSDVAYPSLKVLMYEKVAPCVAGDGEAMGESAEFWLSVGQTQYYQISACSVDGSGRRTRQSEGVPAALGQPFGLTRFGVLGRDLAGP